MEKSGGRSCTGAERVQKYKANYKDGKESEDKSVGKRKNERKYNVARWKLTHQRTIQMHAGTILTAKKENRKECKDCCQCIS